MEGRIIKLAIFIVSGIILYTPVFSLTVSGVIVNGNIPPTYLGSYQDSFNIILSATADTNATWYLIINSTIVSDSLNINLANDTDTLSYTGSIDLSPLSEAQYDVYLFVENSTNSSITTTILLGTVCVDRTPSSILQHYYKYNTTINGTTYVGMYTRLYLDLSENCNLSRIIVSSNDNTLVDQSVNGTVFADYIIIPWGIIGEGTHTINVTVMDEAGNIVNINDTLYIDLTPPEILNVSEEHIIFNGNLSPPNITFNITFSEPVIIGINVDNNNLAKGLEITSGSESTINTLTILHSKYLMLCTKIQNLHANNIQILPISYTRNGITTMLYYLSVPEQDLNTTGLYSTPPFDPTFESYSEYEGSILVLDSISYSLSYKEFSNKHEINIPLNIISVCPTIYYLVDICDYGFNCRRFAVKPSRDYDGILLFMYETRDASNLSVALQEFSNEWFFISLPFDIDTSSNYFADLIIGNPYLKISIFDNGWKDGKNVFGKLLYGYAINFYNLTENNIFYKNCFYQHYQIYSTNPTLPFATTTSTDIYEIFCVLPFKIRNSIETTNITLHRGWNLIGVYNLNPFDVSIFEGKYIFNNSLFTVRTGPYPSIAWVAYPDIPYLFTFNPATYELVPSNIWVPFDYLYINESLLISEITPIWVFSTEDTEYYYPALPGTTIVQSIDREGDTVFISDIDPFSSDSGTVENIGDGISLLPSDGEEGGIQVIGLS